VNKVMRYRYITANCKPDDKIYHFRMISHMKLKYLTNYVGKIIYRIHIPEDLQLDKCSCEDFSTTEDQRLIKDFDYDVMVTMWNGKRKIIPKGVDIETFLNEQFTKWRKSLMENPETAYRPV